MSTAAPATAAPCGSVTVPRIVPRNDWARAGAATRPASDCQQRQRPARPTAPAQRTAVARICLASRPPPAMPPSARSRRTLDAAGRCARSIERKRQLSRLSSPFLFVCQSFFRLGGLESLRAGASYASRMRLMRPSAAARSPCVGSVVGWRSSAPAAGPRGGAAPSAPNVLLVTIDTLRADRLGCYGHAAASTPILDALAARGVRFATAVAPRAADRSVARVDPHRASPRSATASATTAATCCPPSVRSAAEDFRQAGYRTAAFVSGFPARPALRLRPRLRDLRRPPAARQRSRAGRRTSSGSPTPPPTPPSRWLDARRPPARRQAPSSCGCTTTIRTRPTSRPAIWPSASALALRRRDRVRGRPDRRACSRGLEEQGALERHARARDRRPRREPRRARRGHPRALPLRRDAAGPVDHGRARACPPAACRDTVARGIDVLPTLLDYAGLAGAERRRGPLAASGRGRAARWRTRPPTPSRSTRSASTAGRRSSPWRTAQHKLIEAPRPELYDLQADAGEADDRLAAGRRPRLEALRRELQAALARPAPRGRRRWTPDTAERLAALGYVGGGRRRAAPARDRAATRRTAIGLVPRLGRNGMSVARTEPELAIRELTRGARRGPGPARWRVARAPWPTRRPGRHDRRDRASCARSRSEGAL